MQPKNEWQLYNCWVHYNIAKLTYSQTYKSHTANEQNKQESLQREQTVEGHQAPWRSGRTRLFSVGGRSAASWQQTHSAAASTHAITYTTLLYLVSKQISVLEAVLTA